MKEEEIENTENTENDTDIVLEEIVDLDNEGNEKNLQQKNKELRNKIKELEKEKSEYLDGWQRSKADSINKDRQNREETAKMLQFANKRLLLELVPVMDSFIAAMGNKQAWDSVDANWRVGVEYIRSQLNTVFENHKLTLYGEIGDIADPHLYNTLETVDTDKKIDDGKVESVLQYGYKLEDSIIREAKCKTYIYKN